MDELKKLLAALHDNIDPKLQTQLLDIFEILDKENQKTVLDALKEGLEKKKIIEAYKNKRREVVTAAVKKTDEIETRADKKYKEAMKAVEAETSSGEANAADDMINKL